MMEEFSEGNLRVIDAGNADAADLLSSTTDTHVVEENIQSSSEDQRPIDCKQPNWIASIQHNASSTHVQQNSNEMRSKIDLCPFFINRKCKFASNCRYIHGEECPHCHRYCLHPYRLDEKEAHISMCKKSTNADEFLDVECGICYEKILETKEARFGLLNCNHSFCLSCIKSWRLQNSAFQGFLPTNGPSVQTVRSCPICRTVTHFITPTAIWPSSEHEKIQIIEKYKQKLSQISCKYFKEGNGDCPFGVSCFYAHKDKHGNSVEGMSKFSRITVDYDGKTLAVPHLMLSEFIILLSEYEEF